MVCGRRKNLTAPASIGFRGVAPRIHRLASGTLMLVTGRPGPVVLRFSVDRKGERWSQPATIFEGRSTHYADAAEISPGKVLVVYDSIPYGWYEIPFADRDARNRVFGTFVEIGEK